MYHWKNTDSIYFNRYRNYFCEQCKIYFRSVTPFKLIHYNNMCITRELKNEPVTCPNCLKKNNVEILPINLNKVKEKHPNIIIERRK